MVLFMVGTFQAPGLATLGGLLPGFLGAEPHHFQRCDQRLRERSGPSMVPSGSRGDPKYTVVESSTVSQMFFFWVGFYFWLLLKNTGMFVLYVADVATFPCKVHLALFCVPTWH